MKFTWRTYRAAIKRSLFREHLFLSSGTLAALKAWVEAGSPDGSAAGTTLSGAPPVRIFDARRKPIPLPEPLPAPHPHDLPVLARHGIKLDQWWNMTPEQRRDARDSVAHANYQENR